MYLWTLSISPVTPIPIPLATHHLSTAATSQSPRFQPSCFRPPSSSLHLCDRVKLPDLALLFLFIISSCPCYSTTNTWSVSGAVHWFVFSLLLFLDDCRLFIQRRWFCPLQTPVFHLHFRRKKKQKKNLLVRVFFLFSSTKTVVSIGKNPFVVVLFPYFVRSNSQPKNKKSSKLFLSPCSHRCLFRSS